MRNRKQKPVDYVVMAVDNEASHDHHMAVQEYIIEHGLLEQ